MHQLKFKSKLKDRAQVRAEVQITNVKCVFQYEIVMTRVNDSRSSFNIIFINVRSNSK